MRLPFEDWFEKNKAELMADEQLFKIIARGYYMNLDQRTERRNHTLGLMAATLHHDQKADGFGYVTTLNFAEELLTEIERRNP